MSELKRGSFKVLNRTAVVSGGAGRALLLPGADNFLLPPGAVAVVTHFTRAEVSYEDKGLIWVMEESDTAPWTDVRTDFARSMYLEGYRDDDSAYEVIAGTPPPEGETEEVEPPEDEGKGVETDGGSEGEGGSESAPGDEETTEVVATESEGESEEASSEETEEEPEAEPEEVVEEAAVEGEGEGESDEEIAGESDEEAADEADDSEGEEPAEA